MVQKQHGHPLLVLLCEVTFQSFSSEEEAGSRFQKWKRPAPAGTAQIRWEIKQTKKGLTHSIFLKGMGVCLASFLLALIINT